MTLLEAIKERHSVRRYIDKPIDKELIDTLQNKVDEVNAEGRLHIQLVTDEPKAFKGKMAYGTFRGVSNYFAMIGKKSDDLSERIGYYGEELVLLAQTLGLGTCWVGLTYNNVKEAYEIGEDEKLCCLIALGYSNDPGRNVRRKAVKDVSNASEATPEWFRKGVEAALLAPTAVNQQRFFFTYIGTNKPTSLPKGNHEPMQEHNGSEGGQDICLVRAERKFSLIGYTKMDLGIAKLHFEIGAGKENFRWE